VTAGLLVNRALLSWVTPVSWMRLIG
jgi:hypothetical protein